jgi:hypothetical protein
MHSALQNNERAQQRSGMAESFVNTFKRNYVSRKGLANASTVIISPSRNSQDLSIIEIFRNYQNLNTT